MRKTADMQVIEIMGKKRYKRSLADLRKLSEIWYEYWISKLNMDDLINFYENVYIPHISIKNNANVKDLIKQFDSRILNPREGEDLFFIYVRNAKNIYWWAIVVYNKIGKRLILWFRAYVEIPDIILNVWLWTVLEYLFFDFALNKNDVDIISRGKDRNWYWFLWSNLSLTFHKLHYWFLPYNFEWNVLLDIDDKLIKEPCIIYDSPNEIWCFKKVYIYNYDESLNLDIDLLKNKWFEILFR